MSSPLPDSSTLRRFAIVALVLPTAIVFIDHVTWMNRWLLPSHLAARQFFFPWMVTKIALVAWCAGRIFGLNFYGWLLLVWGVVLIDVHSYGAVHGLFGSSDIVQFPSTLISAQLGFLAVWAILGHVSAAWRLAAGLLAATGIIYHASLLSDDWYVEPVPIVQTVAAIILAVLCLSLRAAGFGLQQIAQQAEQSETSRPKSFQFGVKHMLIWTAAMAPLLVVLRGLDWLAYQRLGVSDVYPAAVISACTAVVTLAAIWFAIGAGGLLLRSFGLAAAVAASGVTMYLHNSHWIALYGPWPSLRVIGASVALGTLWPYWFALLAALLAAMLLFFRAAGFRLARVCDPTAACRQA